MTRVLVCGGREYDDRDRVFSVLNAFDRDRSRIGAIIHGACMKRGSIEIRGADRWAEEWAKEKERIYIGMPAKWTHYGKAAGMKRNGEMASRTKPDVVIAFPGGTGTAGMCRIAYEFGIEVIEVKEEAAGQ